MDYSQLSDVELITQHSYQTTAADWADHHNTDQLWASELDRLAQRQANGHVLDVGSGNGRDAELLISRGYQVTGIDIVPALLAIARQRCPQASFSEANVYRLPFADSSFEIIWAVASLLHLPKARLPLALAELRRVSNEHAQCLIIVKTGYGEALVDNAAGQRFFAYYQLDELRELLAAAGFIIWDSRLRQLATTEWLCVWAQAE